MMLLESDCDTDIASCSACPLHCVPPLPLPPSAPPSPPSPVGDDRPSGESRSHRAVPAASPPAKPGASRLISRSRETVGSLPERMPCGELMSDRW